MSVSTFKAAVILHISAIKACVTQWLRGCRDCDRMVVGFTTTCAMSAYHHKSCQFEPRSWWGVLYITLCDKVCQWLATGRWFSAGTPASSTKKTDCHDITEILLKVALNTINEAKLTQWLFVNMFMQSHCQLLWNHFYLWSTNFHEIKNPTNNETWEAVWHLYIAIYVVLEWPRLSEPAAYGTVDNFNDEISTSILFNGL